jgi:uncharacterized glyoxalase superfamily protein PhnB
MKPNPKGWPRFSSAIFYDDAARAIDWLCKAFGFKVRLKVEGDDGSIKHCELEYGDGLIMIGATQRDPLWKSPRSLDGANTQSLQVYVDDAEAHLAHAKASGAKILKGIELHDYGEGYWADKSYEAEDLEGHRWWVCERVKDY